MAFQKLDEEELIYHGRVFDLVRAKVRVPDGREHAYDLVRHSGAVVILPVDAEGRVWFVRQYRVGAEQVMLELPAGLLEEGEQPESTAAREIQEEIGMAAGKMTAIGEFYMVPGYSTEKMHGFLAEDLRESALEPDEDEDLEPVAFPIREVYQMARSGMLTDGKSLAVLLMAQPILEQWEKDHGHE
jgi:ADP-ribose pyrophosphatase